MTTSPALDCAVLRREITNKWQQTDKSFITQVMPDAETMCCVDASCEWSEQIPFSPVPIPLSDCSGNYATIPYYEGTSLERRAKAFLEDCSFVPEEIDPQTALEVVYEDDEYDGWVGNDDSDKGTDDRGDRVRDRGDNNSNNASGNDSHDIDIDVHINVNAGGFAGGCNLNRGAAKGERRGASGRW